MDLPIKYLCSFWRAKITKYYWKAMFFTNCLIKTKCKYIMNGQMGAVQQKFTFLEEVFKHMFFEARMAWNELFWEEEKIWS